MAQFTPQPFASHHVDFVCDRVVRRVGVEAVKGDAAACVEGAAVFGVFGPFLVPLPCVDADTSTS